ncbi:RES family NAD+ phosphorylase [Spirosoma fluminis]
MEVYRINKEPYHTDPLSVIGSYRHGGRWNPKGIGILYTSRTPELALLETLVHLPPLTLPELPRLWLSTIRLPVDLDKAIFWLNPNRLPPYWRAGTLAETQTILTDWLLDPFSLAIAIPSAIIDTSYNLLLHPQHPAFAQVEVVAQRPLPLDGRLLRQ